MKQREMDERDQDIGHSLAFALGLSVRPATGRYILGDGQGDKTAVGLAREVRAILEGPEPLTAAPLVEKARRLEAMTEEEFDTEVRTAHALEGTAPPEVPPKELPEPRGAAVPYAVPAWPRCAVCAVPYAVERVDTSVGSECQRCGKETSSLFERA